MSVASRNPFALIEYDETISAPASASAANKAAAPTLVKKDQPAKGPSTRGGRYYQRGGGAKPAPRDEPVAIQEALLRRNTALMESGTYQIINVESGTVLATSENGAGTITLCQYVENVVHQRWRFERLSDDDGGEEQRLTRELIEKDQLLAVKDRQLASNELQMANKDAQLLVKHRELMETAGQLAAQSQQSDQLEESLLRTQAQLTEATERLASKDQEIDRLRCTDLASSGESERRRALQDALSRANDAVRDRDIELLKLQNQMLREKVDRIENGASDQRRETEELRETVKRLEHLLMHPKHLTTE
ncbi:hypothetical protein FRC09_015946 [Ceratobasidium sp. 395]|nr:hypothetical protein FRC09_015946 [Ceratobasidium sp. 395]